MAIKLSMTDTAIVLWSLRTRYEDVLVRNIPEDKETLEDLKRLIKSYDRSFKAQLRAKG